MLDLLTLVALAAWTVQALFPLPDHAHETLRHIDTGLCLVFLADFAVCLYRAPDRLRYLRTRGWIDLVSSLPGLRFLRWGRIFRAVQIGRDIRRGLSAGTLETELRFQLPQSVFLGTLSLSILLAIGASIAIVEVERAHGGSIDTGEDALWWSVVTMTTVGYGDLYPQTLAGRALAIILMTVGIGIFGTFTSYVGARLTRSRGNDLSSEVRNLRREIELLREIVTRGGADGAAPDADLDGGDPHRP